VKFKVFRRLFVCLFYLYPPVTRKRRWCYQTNTHPLNFPFSEFSGCFFDFLPLNLLLVRSYQAEIILVKRLF